MSDNILDVNKITELNIHEFLTYLTWSIQKNKVENG